MRQLIKTQEEIGELDFSAMREAACIQKNLTKPEGSLGVLEDLAIKVAGITGNAKPTIGDKVIITMAADHGVAMRGVSAYPPEVTAQMVQNFIQGGAAINVLARHVGARIVVVDMGMSKPVNNEGVLKYRIREGTCDIACGPAMSRKEAIACLEAGIEIAQNEVNRGAKYIGTGDMGIGNTTAASAVLAALSGLPAEKVVGRGTGINEATWRLKVETVASSLRINRPDSRDAVEVLAAVGGLEIGGLAGCILGAASCRVPVIIDGFISGAAALLAARLQPRASNFMIASHLSKEPGHRFILDLLGLEPMLYMNMRLGEGTGAVLAMGIIDSALKIMHEMATFESARVSRPD
ncbi:MAG: nicotinate-nucleotide--dimethylbenzimidazole phosphoribosyltransferase [Chitinophagales bacterium]